MFAGIEKMSPASFLRGWGLRNISPKYASSECGSTLIQLAFEASRMTISFMLNGTEPQYSRRGWRKVSRIKPHRALLVISEERRNPSLIP